MAPGAEESGKSSATSPEAGLLELKSKGKYMAPKRKIFTDWLLELRSKWKSLSNGAWS